MAPDSSFEDLLTRLKDGAPEAATEIFTRFRDRLALLARSRLSTRLRGKIDEEDVLQSVFRSFFVRQRRGQLQTDSWDQLWNVLVLLTIRKCCGKADYFQAARRDVRRETVQAPTDSGPPLPWDTLAREPTPDEEAALIELVENLLHCLSPRDRQIVGLSLEGGSTPEIAAAAKCSERTVMRVLERIKKQLERKG